MTRVKRTEPLIIDVRGVQYEVPAPSRAQVRACLALDADVPADETPVAADERRAAQLAALVIPHPATPAERWQRWLFGLIGRPVPGLLPLAQLTADEEREILTAVFCAHFGLDPNFSISALRLGKQLAEARAIAASAASTTTASPSPSISEPTSPAPSESVSTNR